MAVTLNTRLMREGPPIKIHYEGQISCEMDHNTTREGRSALVGFARALEVVELELEFRVATIFRYVA